VESITSLLDVPLLESPPRPVKELVKNIQTIESPMVDKDLARQELARSPIYRNLIVSPDLKTSALLLNLPTDEVYFELLDRRNHFNAKRKKENLNTEEKRAYQKVLQDFKDHRTRNRVQQHQLILNTRSVMDRYREDAELFLGGVNMIADDLISFVKNDLKVFGFGVTVFLIITLMIIFGQIRWVFLPLICVVFSAVAMLGLLGLFGWEVTVISSNFISLQLIITMALTIHLIVRYRELAQKNPDWEQKQLVLDTVRSMAQPCTFAILTTIAGFGSLIFSDILPVINFGWMMSAGISISLLLTFLIFPTVMVLLKKRTPNVSFESHFRLTNYLAQFTQQHGTLILLVSAVTLILSGIGISRLIVENSFINYFKESTEIFQGLKTIDQQLGGTTPLEVVVDLQKPPGESPGVISDHQQMNGNGIEDDLFSEFEEEFEAVKDEAKYWFTSDKMEQVMNIHNYLDSIPDTGKVLSLGTMLKVGENLNDGKPLDNFQLALVYHELPERYRDLILTPYVSVEYNQLRFFTRVKDSEKDLRRNEFLKKIEKGLTEDLGLKKENVHLAGLLVLYNNMLQSLFGSQILTLGVTLGALMIMFLILFRSFILSLIAIFPNVLSIGVVLGFMGWMKIPLDMMTITIAAISVGIAVDDTIHYIHRFRKEFQKDKNYSQTMNRCHGSIGYAMFYTSITIIIGFSILIFSNFIPTIYFGLLTGLAMIIALISALTLLPQLIVWLKPFGREGIPG
jgi:hypothetical protein